MLQAFIVVVFDPIDPFWQHKRFPLLPLHLAPGGVSFYHRKTPVLEEQICVVIQLHANLVVVGKYIII